MYGSKERVGPKERLESSPNHMIYGLEKQKEKEINNNDNEGYIYIKEKKNMGLRQV